MKKLKEFLMLLIPFAALSTLSVIWFAINTQGGVRYLQLMFADSFFIIALMHTFVPPIIISFIVCLFYKLIVSFMKIKMTRKIDYIILFVLSLIPYRVFIRDFTYGYSIFYLDTDLCMSRREACSFCYAVFGSVRYSTATPFRVSALMRFF